MLLAGGCVAVFYATQDLTLSHYDAKAHLVVARRIADSLTPGWKQIGAVWLPLPHVLNAVPVQVDALYRTGLSGVVISVVSFAVAAAALGTFVYRVSGSLLAAATTALVFGTDPNVLYLQSTPMTEPLLFALLGVSVLTVSRWLEDPAARPVWIPGLALALACMTRYEAWPVTAALVGLGMAVEVRGGIPAGTALRIGARLATWPVTAVVLFVINSRVATDQWFVTGGFFVAENEAHGRPLVAIEQVVTGLTEVAGLFTVAAAALGGLVALWWFVRDRRRAHALIGLALIATAALPIYAFVEGHPFRVRYVVALTLAVSVGCGFAVAALSRAVKTGSDPVSWGVPLQLGGLLSLLVAGPSPLDARAPMVTEAQWDRPRGQAREAVTRCLSAEFSRPRDKILASMGSLAHYMHELSRAGFRLDDFVHEGTDDLWPEAVDAPTRHVQWILFEEVAEGGDVLTQRRHRFPGLVDGFVRTCEGGGVALYRQPPPKDIALE